VRGQLELAEQDDALVRLEDVVEERLVEPDRAQRAGAVAQEQLEDLEPGAAGRPDAAADDLADDRRRLAGAQRRDRLEVAAILVADRESIEEVLDGVETDAFEIGGAPRADTFQVLQRRLERVYCTTIASPLPTRISLMRAGSSKGSSMPMPLGFSAERE
jgi:ABC-type transporter Mla subunit MlaD